MGLTFDPAKRQKTLNARGLDFRDAGQVIDGDSLTRQDTRFDYGEDRFVTAGYLQGRFVVVVWTPRENNRHIISLRYGHGHEQARWLRRMGRSR